MRRIGSLVLDPEPDTLTFDCYGTLIDWERGIADALSPVLARHGHPLDDEAILERYALIESALEAGPYLSYREVLRRGLDALGAQLGFEPSEPERHVFGASVADWPAFADSRAVLARLKERYRLVILSNVDDDLFAASAARLGVAFDEVITAQQVGSYKPALRNFEAAIERVGPADRILHVAQSLFHDIAPARRVGLRAVWVNRRAGRPGSGATAPSDARPEAEVPDLRTLADLLVN
jgi:2-haloacid dehalogenase